MVHKRRFFQTNKGYLGLGPWDTKPGDSVVVLFGGRLPFILRECDKWNDEARNFEFLEISYVHGLMDGEGLEVGEEMDFNIV